MIVYNEGRSKKGAIPMMTVHEVSRLTGVSVRALQYYDGIGLLRPTEPTEYTEAGYRLYDEAALERCSGSWNFP